ncbi:MAG: hypothetical protein ACREBR_04520 [bacterium]
MKDEVKIRKSWPDDFDPKTKIHKIKTDYQRNDNKKEIQKALDQEEEDNADLDLDWLPNEKEKNS